MSDPTVSVVIPVWNGAAYLVPCLTALLAQEGSSFEVLVVDNASSDGSATLVTEQFPTVRLIRNATNLGFAGGCNVGLRAARGNVLILLNQDTRVEAGWLAALVESLQDEQIGIVGCKIFYPDGVTLQHAGAWFEWPLGLAHHHGYGEADSEEWSTPREVEAVTGASLALRRDVLEKVGLLDEGFWPGYFEDADLCLRIRKAGYQIWYQPAAKLTHQESTSIADPILRSHFYQKGRLRFLLKHLDPHRFLSEFVPAEEVYQKPAIFGLESYPLRQAYLETLLDLDILLHQCWQADRQSVERVSRAVRQLYEQAWGHDWARSQAHIGPIDSTVLAPYETGFVVLPEIARAPLRPFRFRSDVPGFGGLISRFRQLWYEVAARWAIDDLRDQQALINQRQGDFYEQQAVINQQQRALNRRMGQTSDQQYAYFEALEKQIQQLAEENALLAGEMGTLRLFLSNIEEKKEDGR